MRSIYDQEMRDIQRDSIHMCNLAAETLQDVMDAVRRRDFTVVDRVLEQDQRIRSMRMAINERVMRMIATQHPVAVDLRKLFCLVHTADEMERIGYQAAAIGRAIERTESGKVLLVEDIYRMSERAATMFEKMLTSSLGQDAERVNQVLQMDDEVDVLYEQIYRECITRQTDLQSQDEDVMTAVSVAQYIEHVGDHIVNWARWWLYFNGDQNQGGDIIV
jgi:phosphate transport system protein